MKLSDLIPADHIVVEISEADLRAFHPELLQEQGWRPAPYPGWSYRIDPARPQMMQLRHVHVARSNQTSAKNKQVAWNDDGTRHDKMSFNANLKGLGVAKSIARQVLKLPDDFLLEHMDLTEAQSLVLREGVEADGVPPVAWLLSARAPGK